MTSLDPLDWLDPIAVDRERQSLARRLTPRGPSAPGRFSLDGRAVINFGSNDYLGLAHDPRVVDAACRAAGTHGWGAGASPLVSGWSDLHQRLADDLARFEGVDAVALFPTGFAANVGTVAALVGPGDAVYLDRLNHASLVEGAKASGARLRVYPHANADGLGAILERDRGRFRRCLIATDSVFSMDGDLAPLARLAELAETHNAMLLADEAHATGVFGPGGRGVAELLRVDHRVPIRIGTLSKALGSVGGFVAGSRRLIRHIINHAATLIYSTALPAPAVAAATAALAIVRDEPDRRLALMALASTFRERLKEIGYDVSPAAGPIVPIAIGDPTRAVNLSQALLERGLFVPAIRPPTVPAGTSRLRVSLTADHTLNEAERLLDALTRGVPT